MSDLRFALRSLLKSPGFTFVAVLTLALGIGANTAIFSYVYAILLRPLPFAAQDRLVAVSVNVKREQLERRAFSMPYFRDHRARATRNFAELAAYSTDSSTLTGQGASERLFTELVSSNYFATLGVTAERGRLFRSTDDDAPNKSAVVLLGDALWRSRFGGRDDMVGRTIRLNESEYTVVGVLPPGFRGVSDTAQIWVPMAMAATIVGRDAWDSRNWHWHEAVGRLKPGVSVAQANAELASVADGLEKAYPASDKDYLATAKPLRDELVGDLRQPLLIVLGAVAFVLLITCVNVANLMLVRLNGRSAELSIRASLGAARLQLARLFFAEAVWLGLAGGGLALLVAQWGVDALRMLNPVELPQYVEATLNWPVFAFAAGTALVSTVAVGLLPAWAAARHDLVTALKGGGRTAGPSGNPRARAALMAAEIALSLALLTGAGLMAKSYARLSRLDPGYRTTGLFTAAFDLPTVRYDLDKAQAFHARLLDQLRAVPGVRRAALATDTPLDDNDSSSSYTADAAAGDPAKNVLRGYYHFVTREYFATAGIALRQGETFAEGLKPDGEGVVVVSESLARKYWPGGNAVGRRLRPGGAASTAPWLRIVGVVAETKYRQLPENPTRDPDVYLPLVQSKRRSASIAVEAAGSAAGLLPDLRRVIAGLDPELPLYNTGAIENRIARRTAGARFTAQLIGLFSGLALVLACLGIYGVVSFNVGLRTHEIGLRQALGASHRDIFRLILGGTGRVALVGLAGGLGLALAIARLIQSQLYEVSAVDPGIYAAGALLLAAVTLLAAWFPARRAARVDPMVALRAE